MSMDFSLFLEILLVTTPCVVIFSVCIGVGGCVCQISSSYCRAGISSLQLMNSAPSSASSADYMNALMIFAIVNNAPLLGGKVVLFGINKSPPARLLVFVSERYEASLWPARTISLACYVIMASGWVAA